MQVYRNSIFAKIQVALLLTSLAGCEISLPVSGRSSDKNNGDGPVCSEGNEQINGEGGCYPVLPVYLIPGQDLPANLEQVPAVEFNSPVILAKPEHLLETTNQWQIFVGDSLGFYAYYETLAGSEARTLYTPGFPGFFYFKLCSDKRCFADTVLRATGVMNLAPEAEVRIEGDPVVFIGQSIQITADESYDPEGDALSFEWTASAPDGKVMTIDAATATVDFFPGLPGTYRVDARVTDGFENPIRANFQTDFTFVYARMAGNTAPQAVANSPDTIEPGEAFHVDLGGTIDDEGDSLSVRWDLFRYDTAGNFYEEEQKGVSEDLVFDIYPLTSSEYILFLRVDDYVERNCDLTQEEQACTSIEFVVVAE